MITTPSNSIFAKQIVVRMLLLPRLLPPLALYPLLLLLSLQLRRAVAVAKFPLAILFLLAKVGELLHFGFVEPVDNRVKTLLHMDTFDLVVC